MKIYKKSLLYGALAFTLCMAGGCNSNIDLEPEGIITAVISSRQKTMKRR